MTKDADKALALRSGPPQAHAKFQLRGVKPALHAQFGQRSYVRRVVVQETRAEDLHKIIFGCRGIAPPNRNIDMLFLGGFTKGEHDSGKERPVKRRLPFAGLHQFARALAEPNPHIAYGLDHVPAMNKKDAHRVMPRRQR